jgi:hypothetical protein
MVLKINYRDVLPSLLEIKSKYSAPSEERHRPLTFFPQNVSFFPSKIRLSALVAILFSRPVQLKQLPLKNDNSCSLSPKSV